MAEEVEKKEEVTVKTPEKKEEATEETVVEQPAAKEEEQKPTPGKGKSGTLDPWNKTHWNDASKTKSAPLSTGEQDAKPAGVPVSDAAVGTNGNADRESGVIKDNWGSAPENITPATPSSGTDMPNGSENGTDVSSTDIDTEGGEGQNGIIFPDKKMHGPTLNNPDLKPADEFKDLGDRNWIVSTEDSSKGDENNGNGDVGEGDGATGAGSKEPENQEGESQTKKTTEDEDLPQPEDMSIDDADFGKAADEENAEGVAKEIQGIDPNTIPTDPDDFQAWVQSKPELKNFYNFMIDDSDAKLKASQKKQRREQMGIALGNLMRAFVNLGTTMHGGLNSYNHESADKIRKEAGEQEEKWRKELENARKERWEQYQKLRDQYFKENQDRRAASKEEREERKELFNEEQKRYDRLVKENKDRRDEQMFQARLAGILTDNRIKEINEEYQETKNQLDIEHKEAQIRLANRRIQDIGDAAADRAKNAESNKTRADAYANGKKDNDNPTPPSISGEKEGTDGKKERPY